jgi:hypothetical protein
MNADHIPVPPREIQTLKPTGAPLFQLGQIVATPAALALLERHVVQPATLLHRHVHGDWGDMDKHDRAANYAALKDGSRIFSAYVINKDKFWVITEAASDDDGLSRASTAIILPQEY